MKSDGAGIAMSKGMPVRPILGHAIVDSNGRSVRRLRVFCARLGHSLDYEACKTCPAYRATVDGNRIECRADGPGPDEEPSCSHRIDAAGAAPMPKLVCVREDVPATELSRLLADGTPFVLVVGEDGRAIGTVWGNGDAELAEIGALARDLMTSPTIAPETTSIRAALLQMASAHLRAVSIVTSDGSPVGLLRDVDALGMWTALRRRGF
jgi:CBS domain-containing protein